MKSMTCCMICGGELADELKLYDDRYGYVGTFTLVACRTCGHQTLITDFSSDQICSLYTEYYQRSTETTDDLKAVSSPSGFRSWLNGEKRFAFCWVPEKVRVLDIGCGFGETLLFHRSRGCEVFGVEADANILRVAERFGFNVHAGLFNPACYESGYFDYVTMDQVIEHMTDPVVTLQGVATVLKSGGMAILSTPNASGWGAKFFGRRWINWHAPYHQHYFSERSMRLAAERAGLIVEQTKTLTSSEWLHLQWNHLFMFPEMGLPSRFWTLKFKRSLRDRLILAIFGLVHRTKVNHILTRFFDSLGRGDNYLYFLRKP